MEKELTSKESLSLITEMIGRAKREAAGDGSFQLLLWGWVVAVCNFGHYLLGKLGYEMPYIVWLLIIPAVGLSIWKGVQEKRKARVKTHLNEVIIQLWLAVFIGMICLIAFMPIVNFNHNPIILLLAAVGVMTTGAMIKDGTLKIGGWLLIVGAIVGFSVPVNDQYLVGGIAIILGYLVPGYLLKKKYKNRV